MIKKKTKYPKWCDEDVRCDEACDGLGCPHMNENGECNITDTKDLSDKMKHLKNTGDIYGYWFDRY